MQRCQAAESDVTPPDVHSRIGAPYDIYTPSDIESSDFPFHRYKLYIMLNALELKAEYGRIATVKLTNDGRTILWIYAPGLYNP